MFLRTTMFEYDKHQKIAHKTTFASGFASNIIVRQAAIL